MSEKNCLASEDRFHEVADYLAKQQSKSMLRFITCGSVDDGKSTLIGRLLYDNRSLFDDQLSDLISDSKKVGTQGSDIDFALLVDGLAAEREQGITIDVAYRYFSTKRRKFIVADTPGHEQFTRNMVTGASTADLAVVMVDASMGVQTQTRRHTQIISLLGVQHIVLAVTKMDIVKYDEEAFTSITDIFGEFASSIGLDNVISIPMSGLYGDNIVNQSERMPWYSGPTLLQHLETVDVDTMIGREQSFLLPVQWVNRPHSKFRGFSGLVSGGSVRVGDSVTIYPSDKKTRISGIFCAQDQRESAQFGESVTVTFTEEVDCSRGQVIVGEGSNVSVADQFETTIVWFDDDLMTPGRSYWMKIGTQTVAAKLQKPKYVLDISTHKRLSEKTFALNAIGVSVLSTDRKIAHSKYADSRELGGFILIDKQTNRTVAAGMINFSLRRSGNIHPHVTTITKHERSVLKEQRPSVIWFTGLSGSGKSTIANELEKQLVSMGHHTFILDGDNVRLGLNKDLGFTDADRIENIRRVGEVAKLMSEAGLIVLASFISPFREERQMLRELMDDGEFIEVFVKTPLEVAEKRDVKGLYAKARAGELKSFTGVDSPYEEPINPEIVIETASTDPSVAAKHIIKYLREKLY